MVKYVVKRLWYMAAVFLIVSAVLYFLYHLIPGDPVKAELANFVKENKNLTAEQIEAEKQAITVRLGLDKPLPLRYVRWIAGLLTGNLGYSQSYRQPVAQVIGAPMQNTVILNLMSVVLALFLTIPLGIACAVKKNSVFDRITQIVTMVGYGVPVYIIALLFIYVFAVVLRWFPVSGMNTPGVEFFSVSGWLLDRMKYMALPLLVMTAGSLGGMTRYVRTAMVDALGQDYIRTARAKGLPERAVIFSHAWRNALLPVIALIISWFLGIFGGSLIIENIFGLNGVGKLLYEALMQKDYELVLAAQMFYVGISLAGNLFLDLIYGVVDPRIRVAG